MTEIRAMLIRWVSHPVLWNAITGAIAGVTATLIVIALWEAPSNPDYIRAIAQLLWPIVVLWSVVWLVGTFKTEVRGLINRILRVKFAGGEVEFNASTEATRQVEVPGLEPEDKVISAQYVKEAMGKIPGMDPEKLDQAYEQAYVILLRNNITTQNQLAILVSSEHVLDALRALYVQYFPTTRRKGFPLDPVAVAAWGVMFLRNGVNGATVDWLVQQIEISEEYKKAHGLS